MGPARGGVRGGDGVGRCVLRGERGAGSRVGWGFSTVKGAGGGGGSEGGRWESEQNNLARRETRGGRRGQGCERGVRLSRRR